MKTISSSRFLALGLSLLLASTAAVQAQPDAAKAGAKSARMTPQLKRAERANGKPLTPAQMKTIRAAGAERKKAMKPINDKYDAAVAKALGLTVDAYKAKVKATAPARKPGA